MVPGSVLVGLAVLGGCSQQVPGVPAADPAPAPTSQPPAATSGSAGSTAQPGATGKPAPVAPSAADCQVTLGAGNVRITGGGRVRTVNGNSQFACRNGPLVAVENIGADGVRFGLDGASVLVAKDGTGTVGPYRITVIQIQGATAQLAVAQ